MRGAAAGAVAYSKYLDRVFGTNWMFLSPSSASLASGSGSSSGSQKRRRNWPAWLHTSAANDEDVTLVLDRWTFPLGGVELSEIRVTKEELRAERENWEARMAGDWV